VDSVAGNVTTLTTSVNTIKANVDSVASNVSNILTGTTSFSGAKTFTDNIAINGLLANGSLGTAGQVLTSNSTSVYWSTVSGPRSTTAGATSGTLTINGDTTDIFVAEGLTGSITFAQPSGTPINGQKLLIRIKDNGTAISITWTGTAGAFRAIGLTLITTTVISKVSYVGCVYNSTDAFWDVIAITTQA
jgi:hypothetical protein